MSSLYPAPSDGWCTRCREPIGRRQLIQSEPTSTAADPQWKCHRCVCDEVDALQLDVDGVIDVLRERRAARRQPALTRHEARSLVACLDSMIREFSRDPDQSKLVVIKETLQERLDQLQAPNLHAGSADVILRVLDRGAEEQEQEEGE